MKTTLFIVLLILLLALLLFIVKSDLPRHSPQPASRLQQQSQVSATSDIARWKVYTGEREGYTLMYPQDWSVVSEERGGGIELLSFRSAQPYGGSVLPPGQFQITINPEWATNNHEDVSEWCRQQLINYRYSPYATIKIVQERKTTIAALPSYVIDSRAKYVISEQVIEDKNWSGDRQVCIARGNTKLGIIGRPLDPRYLPVFDQILTTFKFIRY